MEYLNNAWQWAAANQDITFAIVYALIGAIVGTFVLRKHKSGLAEHVVVQTAWPLFAFGGLVLLSGWAIWQTMVLGWSVVTGTTRAITWPARIFWRGLKHKPGPFDGYAAHFISIDGNSDIKVGLAILAPEAGELISHIESVRCSYYKATGKAKLEFDIASVEHAGKKWLPACAEVPMSWGANTRHDFGVPSRVIGKADGPIRVGAPVYMNDEGMVGEVPMSWGLDADAIKGWAMEPEPMDNAIARDVLARRAVVGDDADTIEAGQPERAPRMAVPYGSKLPEPKSESVDPNMGLLPEGKEWMKLKGTVEYHPMPLRTYKTGFVGPNQVRITRTALYQEIPQWLCVDRRAKGGTAGTKPG